MSNELMSLEDKAALELTQQTRKKIITELTKDGKLPADIADRDFLMKALDGSDRQVLSKAKLKSDDTNGKSQVAAAAMVANLLLQVSSNRDKQPPRSEPLVIPAVELDLIPGETHIGMQVFQLSDVMNPAKS